MGLDDQGLVGGSRVSHLGMLKGRINPHISKHSLYMGFQSFICVKLCIEGRPVSSCFGLMELKSLRVVWRRYFYTATFKLKTNLATKTRAAS